MVIRILLVRLGIKDVIMQEPNYRKLSNVKKHQGYDYARSMTIEKIYILHENKNAPSEMISEDIFNNVQRNTSLIEVCTHLLNHSSFKSTVNQKLTSKILISDCLVVFKSAEAVSYLNLLMPFES